MSNLPATVHPLTAAHRLYVQGLYRRALKQSLDWIVFRDLWRHRAIEIRTEFERNRDVRDPRALARLLADTEAWLRKTEHPDPYRPPAAPEGTKWERNMPPPIFSPSVREQARHAFDRDLAVLEGSETEIGSSIVPPESVEGRQEGGAVAPAS